MLSGKRIPRYIFLFHVLAIVTPIIGTPLPHSPILQPFVPSLLNTGDDHVFSNIPMSPEFDDSMASPLSHRWLHEDIDGSAAILEPRLKGDIKCMPNFNAVDDFYNKHFTLLNKYLAALLSVHQRDPNPFKSLDGIVSIREGKALAERIIKESDDDRASVGFTLRSQAVLFLRPWNGQSHKESSLAIQSQDPTLSTNAVTTLANDISKEETMTNIGKLLQEVNSCVSEHIQRGKAEVAGGNKPPGGKELGNEIAFAREASVLWFLNDGIRDEAKKYRQTLDKQPVKATAVTAPRRNSA